MALRGRALSRALLGRYDNAIRDTRRLKDFTEMEISGDIILVARANFELAGILATIKNQTKLAERLMQQQFKKMKSKRNTRVYAWGLLVLVNIYTQSGKLELALKCHEDALEIYQKINAPPHIADAYCSMAIDLFYMKDYETSQKYAP